MNEQFRNYVTSTAFSLSLSRSMIDVLLLMDAGYMPYNYGRSVPCVCTLERRGLVIHHPKAKLVHSDDIHQSVGPEYSHEVTAAGKVVAELLRLAGFTVNMSLHRKIAS